MQNNASIRDWRQNRRDEKLAGAKNRALGANREAELNLIILRYSPDAGRNLSGCPVDDRLSFYAGDLLQYNCQHEVATIQAEVGIFVKVRHLRRFENVPSYHSRRK